MHSIIFDMDGVLVISEATHFNAWRLVFAKLGLPTKALKYEDSIGHIDDRVAQLLKDKYPQLKESKEALCELKRDLFYNGQTNFVAPTGRDKFIQHAKAQGLSLAVVSSSTKAEIDFILQHEKILHFFDHIISYEDTKQHKPNPEPYLLAIEKLKIEAKDGIVIEDTITGMKAALAAGIKVAGLATTFADLEFADVPIWNDFDQIANSLGWY